uniref:Uncharacterized protein n=2 Tax=Panagrolaimus sp. JU765 TaxID=591449 RepID=A0AC34QXF1_9BILA
MSKIESRNTLKCLKCGLLNLPTSSTTRTICSLPRHPIIGLRISNTRIFNRQIRRLFSTDKRPALKFREASWFQFKRIAKLALPYKKRIGLGFLFLGMGSSIFLCTPHILGKLIDEMDDTKKKVVGQEDSALKLAKYFKNNPWALVLLLVCGAGAIAGRSYCMHTAGQLIINDMRTNVFRRVLCHDMAFFDKNRVGEIVSRLSSDALVVGNAVSTNLSDGLRSLFTLCGSAGLMVYTSPALCAPVTVVIPIIVGTFYVFGKIQRKFTIQMQEAVAGANNVATERLSNIKTVKILVAEKRELEAYKSKIHAIWEICKKEGIFKGIMFGSFQLTGYLAITSVLFYGTHLIGKGLLTYGELSSFCLYAALCVGGLSSLSTFYNELMKGLGASQRLFQLADEKPTIPLIGGKIIDDVVHGIRFEGVGFSYPERDQIFNDVTCKIPAGKITAIVGPSGSGKSTVAHLLLRLYNPTQGRILIDDHELKELDPSHWRRMIGTVPQEPVLFSTTIWENICYGAENPASITNAQVQQAAAQSNSLEFIKTFPKGFQTVIGEAGHSMLSGGQKQRIAIARALITDPKILILDEATSALDATSEYLKTVIIIAHRLSTIKHADQIVVLDKGCVAELGNFDELMGIQDGIFRKLVEKQAIGWRDDQF